MRSERVPAMVRVSTWLPYLWLALFFAVPFLIVLKVSLSETAVAMPPYKPVFSGLEDFLENLKQFSLDNYIWLTEDALYFKAYVSSLTIAFTATIITLLIGYPLA